MAKQTIKYTTKDAYKLNGQVGPRPDTGWSVSTPNVDPNNKNNWNTRLIKPNGKYLNLWVEEASIDFSMSGSTGQSRWRREYYPHSFNEPTLSLKGHMPNQREFNKLAAFVRESHAEALNVGTGSVGAGTNVSEKGRGSKATPTVTLLMKAYEPPNGQPKRNQKGRRRGMKLEGYILSVGAGGQKFDYAPAFELGFVVAASDGMVGIYDDTLVSGSKVVNWMTLFNQDHFGAQSGSEIRRLVGSDTASSTTPGTTAAAPSTSTTFNANQNSHVARNLKW